jgi:glycosyltransferase involved in cell wall biosynthesis
LNRLRLLYSSNAFWSASGYGVQGQSLLPRLAELPEFGSRESIAMFAWYGLQGGVHTVDEFKCYPAGNDPYGNDIIEAHAKNHGANIVVSLIDVWVMQETAKKVAPALWLPWLPIDHDPVPEKILTALDGAYRPLTYSKWGADLLRGAGIENTYIPHGIEPGIFRVIDDAESVANARAQMLGKDGDHLTVMVAANKGFPDRKSFQVQLRSWAEFAKDKPGARLYIHTEPTTMHGGVDLPKLLASLGIGNRVLFPDRYRYHNGFPAAYMSMLYNVADIYLGSTMGEGFGIPIIEAQACGTPVIVTNFSSMPELVRWGYKVNPADMFWTPMNSWQAWPDVRGITEALETLYAQWYDFGEQWPLAQRVKAQDAIHNEFAWDIIVNDQWAPLMADLADVAPPVKAKQAPQIKTLPGPPQAAQNGRESHIEAVMV